MDTIFGIRIGILANLVALSTLLPTGLHAQTANGNNLKGNIGIHDPSSVIKCDGKYYVYATGGGMKVSEDRINWKDGVHPINGANGIGKQTWWSTHGGSIWAPEVSFMDGVYYFFYSVSNSGNVDNSAVGVASNTTLDPASPNYKWVDKGKVIDSKIAGAATKPNVNAIDPSTFLDEDGKWYLAFGSFNEGVRLVELNRATGLMAQPTNPKVWVMTDHTGEASFIHKWKNYYYYSVSRGKCCAGASSDYQVIYGRSSTLVTGPYTNSNGSSFTIYDQAKNTLLLGKGGDYAGGAGGQSFFWDNDTLFMSYHGYLSNGTNLFIKPMYADAQGWLTLESSKGTIMTGAPKSTAIGPKVGYFQNGKYSSARKASSLRVTGAGLGDLSQLSRLGGSLYTTQGQKIENVARGNLPQGILIEQAGN